MTENSKVIENGPTEKFLESGVEGESVLVETRIYRVDISQCVI